MQTLAVKYRPKEFTDVLSQTTVIKILEQQLANQKFASGYLFAGPSGTGKTTLARIFAEKINGNLDGLIEIDGASNNGVDSIKNIIQEAESRSLYTTYKIFIIDEAHQITSAGWNAFLKTLEEPPKYSIFIFCTTEPQKIPVTILNRLMRFNLTKIPTELVKNRLIEICKIEQVSNYLEACDLISKISHNSAREAIMLLEKCLSATSDLSLENIFKILDTIDYSLLFKLTDAIVDNVEINILKIFEEIYNSNIDLTSFIDQYITFILDLAKYSVLEDSTLITIPEKYLTNIKYTIGFDGSQKFFNQMLTTLFNYKYSLKYDKNLKTSITIILLNIARGVI